MPSHKKRALWSLVVAERGVEVRLYERDARGVIYRDVWIGSKRDRRSLGHNDRALAKTQAKALAARLSELRYAGVGPLTLGQLSALYLEDRGSDLSPNRLRATKHYIRLLERHFERNRPIDDLSKSSVESYIAARRSGTLVSPRHRTKDAGVGDGTIRNELRHLLTMIAWAQASKRNGRPLLAGNPLLDVKLPTEANPKRPVATEERYRALLEVADQAEPTGRFRLVLTLARETGHRINAICALSRTDILLTHAQVIQGLADVGLPIAWADAWPHGAIRWRKENDKLGYSSVTPLASAARAAIDVYLAGYPRIGDVPLFAGRGKHRVWLDVPVRKEIAGYWLSRAEKLAKLPKLARGGYHPYRRLFASERRHLPAQDVAFAGGWRDLKTMQTAYQQTDAAGVFNVIDAPRTAPEPEPTRHTSGTPTSQAAAS